MLLFPVKLKFFEVHFNQIQESNLELKKNFQLISHRVFKEVLYRIGPYLKIKSIQGSKILILKILKDLKTFYHFNHVLKLF